MTTLHTATTENKATERRSPNILVVEDQPVIGELICDLIKEMADHSVVFTATSISEARRIIDGQPIDGMVADLRLQDGIVFDLIEDLNHRNVKIPTLLISGFLSTDKLEKAKHLGIEEILHKPFQPEDLKRGLERTLKLHSPKEHGDDSCECVHKGIDKGILNKLFRIDRNAALFSRILHEIPKYGDVGSICSSTLALAKDIVNAQRGFICLFNRAKQELIMVASDPPDVGMVKNTCQLADTPFATLMGGSDGPCYLSGRTIYCWPGVFASSCFALTVMLQGKPAGVLCLMDLQSPVRPSKNEVHILNLLIKELDIRLENNAVHAALNASMKETLIALVRTLEARDRYTKNHSARVSAMSVRFAKGLGLGNEEVELIRVGALLHDIGKVGVPDSVLLKPGRYTDEEFSIMKRHPVIGNDILKHMDTLAVERQIVLYHHERMDGKGYPHGLMGEEIPMAARIVCVADAIDAMTTHRVYRRAQPISYCIEQLKKNAGTQFDASVVEVAVECLERGMIRTQASANGVRLAS